MPNKVSLLVYSVVYNEARFLPIMLESLLTQTDLDFSLLISDNHSIDGTDEIIQSFSSRFPRLISIKPDRHLSGIEHGLFAHAYIVANLKEYTHVMFIGGHDIVETSTIAQLKAGVVMARESAVLYTEAFRLSHEGVPLGRHPASLNTAGVPRILVPFVILLGIVHNTMSSGLWRADVFAGTKPRFLCCAFDHLFLCEAALLGPITYAPGGAILLRDAPDFQPGWQYYVEKHIPKDQRLKGCVYDFTLQITWLINILELCLGTRVANILGNPIYENYFLSALQLYLIRYSDIALGFHDSQALLVSELYQSIQSNDLARLLNVL
jgi:hypothetical protein